MVQRLLHLCEEKADFLLLQCFKKKDALSSHIFHSFLVSLGLDSIAIFQDHLIRVFAACGSLKKCRAFFHKCPFPSLYTWNAIIEAHVKLDCSDVAIQLFYQMKQENIDPDKFSYLPVLKACSRLGDRQQGMLLHGEILCKGIETDNLIVNTLVLVYAKSGSIEDARNVFDNLLNKDVVTWNVIISGYVEIGLHTGAFELADEMVDKGLILNEITYCSLLKACSDTKVSKERKYLIHHKVIRQGIDSVEIVRNSILDTYGRCGDLGAARRIFDRLRSRDVVSWNAMLAAYSQHGQGWVALRLFEEMQNVGQNPDKISFSSILQACGSVGSFKNGMLCHCQIVMLGMECDTVVEKMLVDLYAKCGKLSDACKLFGKLRGKDMVHWNSIIAGYTQRGDNAASLILYRKMQREGVTPNNITCVWVLKACMDEDDVEEGKSVHGEIVRFGLETNASVGSTLLEMYAKFGSIDEGQSVFDAVLERDAVLFNTLIAAYVHSEEPFLASQLFEKMIREGIKPDVFTFSSIAKAAGGLKGTESCRFVHDQILRNGYEDDDVIGNALIDMYAKVGHMREASSIFRNLGSRDAVAWNALIVGHAQLEEDGRILRLFQTMQEEERSDPDGLTYACVLRSCINIGARREGRLAYDKAVRSGLEAETVVRNHAMELYARSSAEEGSKAVQVQACDAWGAATAGHSSARTSGLPSFDWFGRMQAGGDRLGKGACVAVLQSCARHGALVLGRLVHNQLIHDESDESDADSIIASALIDMYAKCGGEGAEDACKLFDRSPGRDVPAWNAVISGHARRGDCARAGACVEEMQKRGLMPDGATYSSILSACSRSGDAAAALQCLGSMSEDHRIVPDPRHFACLADLLGRSGRLEEAESLLKSAPDLPEIHGWRALLSACKAHGGLQIARRCYLETTLSDPRCSSGHVLMSSMCADPCARERARRKCKPPNAVAIGS